MSAEAHHYNCINLVVCNCVWNISAAGIPDFRSPVSGLYANMGRFNLPDPQAVFEIDFFKQNPEPFYTITRELFPADKIFKVLDVNYAPPNTIEWHFWLDRRWET